MTNKNVNVLIVEPSFILSEGLIEIVGKSLKNLHFFKCSDFSEIHQNNLINGIEIIVINSLLVQNQTKQLNALKREFENIRWIGLICTYYDSKVLELFDSTILINDSPDKIVHSIQKLIEIDEVKTHSIKQDALSSREIDVLKLLVSGFSAKEIAEKLFLSTHTVITHRKNISNKTGIKSVAGLTIYAVVNNIVDLEDFNS